MSEADATATTSVSDGNNTETKSASNADANETKLEKDNAQPASDNKSPATDDLAIEAEPDSSNSVSKVDSGFCPMKSGYLSYKNSGLSLPIVHKRFFFLSEVPIELDNLQAFYKKQERRTKISTLNKLVAHASLTGTGLLFWTRDEKSRVISGIIDLYKVCGVVPENAADKFVIEMPDRYIYRFQASSTDERARWIETLKSLAMDSPKAKAAVVGTSEFKELLDKLENGTAFKNRPMVPEEVLSDDEATGSPLAPNTETGDASKADRPKDAKRTSVLGYLPFMKERLSKDDAAKPTPVVKDDTNAVSEA